MNKLRIALMVATSLTLSGQAQAVFTMEQLEDLRGLVSCSEPSELRHNILRAYIDANPGLMAGDDSLAEALRDFMEETDPDRGNACIDLSGVNPADAVPGESLATEIAAILAEGNNLILPDIEPAAGPTTVAAAPDGLLFPDVEPAAGPAEELY